MDLTLTAGQVSVGRNFVAFQKIGVEGLNYVFLISLLCVCMCACDCVAGLRGAPGYSLDQAHHLPIEMDSLIGGFEKRTVCFVTLDIVKYNFAKLNFKTLPFQL